MRIQFEIDNEMWERMKRYSPSEKIRHERAKEALDEWITRREGRDKKLQLERLMADVELLKPVIKHLLNEGELE